LSIKKKVYRKRRGLLYVKRSFIYLLFFLFFLKGFSQDSIPIVSDLTEELELNFQQFFFKALSEKAIGNHQKALENLESCNQITPNNIAVFFEFSKNYLALDDTLLAKEYMVRALKEDPKNRWMLAHLQNILKKEKQYSRFKKSPNKITFGNLKDRLEIGKKNKIKKRVGAEDIFKAFEIAQSYEALKNILEHSQENTAQLLEYSAKGILLFPAQPFVYLMHGKALNLKKSYSKAVQTLKDGLDFVYEASEEAEFYAEFIIAYRGLGDEKKAEKYRQKSKKIKN
jgi:tetratricopeptide (TPR) repeat protein